jgi:hypothetical protein
VRRVQFEYRRRRHPSFAQGGKGASASECECEPKYLFALCTPLSTLSDRAVLRCK